MLGLQKIINKGLTLIVKNHGIIILYLDKETLIKKFNVFCQNTLLYNYNAFMDGWGCHFPERIKTHFSN